MTGKLGFIGLGTIGGQVAMNLIDKGNSLVVFDLDQAATAKLIGMGAQGRATPAQVASDSDIVFTMVPDAPDVEKAALGPGGIIEGIREGALYVDMSTIDPATSRRIGAAIAARGARMLDAPVARTPAHARTGNLAIMVGGDPDDVEAAMPVLRQMGDSVVYCGALGNGHAMKLVNNYISAGSVAILSEALTFGVKAGLKLEDIHALVMSTFARSGILGEVLPKKAFLGDFEAGFFTRLSMKDQRLALGLAETAGIDAPAGRGVFEALRTACEQGYETKDFSSMFLVREAEAGVQVRLADAPKR